ncbi:glycerophosphodiester phosphodiesterase [Pseudoalteromonas sp. NBT06-2]|uniref:glycerophosphodiester phosphodiesterase n=1 Tax=Pseudoalteromonas sp. NBT06-2 TaxID=2025950 RepID=UPI000BA70914|nr:glycerophosphodiester phosphodiesterase family protein [Pseudoalteromonas sp. NBT06-2]PAJ76082.1 glycerophosphodiester phosphodiesterase [Pseudoalteromonas sp. NBT06-2]
MKVFAHRGASGNYPENTQSAINAALDIEVDGIEVDLQSAKDAYVIIHDSWLDRTTNGRGKVSNYTMSQLKKFDAGSGERIPSLENLIDWNNNQTLLNIELKHTFELINLIEDIKNYLSNGKISQENLIISSYDHHQLKFIKQQLPWLKIGALTSSIPIEYAKFAQELNAFSIHIDKDFINQAFVSDAHQRGLKVYAYTLDKIEDIELMLALGVDGIFTNFPATTKSMLQNMTR